jgi:hypothetical protein
VLILIACAGLSGGIFKGLIFLLLSPPSPSLIFFFKFGLLKSNIEKANLFQEDSSLFSIFQVLLDECSHQGKIQHFCPLFLSVGRVTVKEQQATVPQCLWQRRTELLLKLGFHVEVISEMSRFPPLKP